MPELDTRLEALFARIEASAGAPRAPARSGRPRRKLWVIALAVIAIAIVGATIAAAGGLLDFRDPHPNETTFPNEVTCKPGTNVCTPGRSAGGKVFALFKVGESARDVQVVGGGVDTGDGKQVTPLVCTASRNGIECGAQPAGGEKELALYLPA